MWRFHSCWCIRRNRRLKMIGVLIAVLLLKNQSAWAECVTPTESKIRSFDTLAHYQGNKLPFNPTSAGWLGSNVEFRFKTLEKISKNTFITKDSDFVASLNLSDKGIKALDDGAFISLTCLKQLFLDHNNIYKLSRNMFQGLSSLERLDLSYNSLELLQDLTFSHLVKLKRLNLCNNRIKSVEMLTFTNLTSLEHLDLSLNQLSKVSDDLFQPLRSLVELVLSWNRLWNIQPERWTGLYKLQSLEFSGNNLKHFDPTYNFSFSNLKSLNLSFNSLTVLNVEALRQHLPVLEQLDLNNNSWFCDDLEQILHQFYDSKIKLPAKNLSSVGVNGIACNKVKEGFSSTTEVLLSSSTISPKWVNEDRLEEFVEKKIKDNNEKVYSSIEGLRAMVICVFGLLCVLIVIELAYRTNVCGLLIYKLKGSRDVFIDDGTDLENFRLLQTR